MIKSVIFDIGGVLSEFNWDKYVSRYFSAETAVAVTAATWHNPDWAEFDRGVLSFDEVLSKLISFSPEYEKEIRFVIGHIGECPVPEPFAVPWIKELKEKGYRVFYLSNYFEYLMKANPAAIGFTEYMDGGIFSCHEKMIKPDRRIYLRLCEKYGLEPSECLFIDDRPVNVKGAENAGMKAFVFESYEKSFAPVMKILSDSITDQ